MCTLQSFDSSSLCWYSSFWYAFNLTSVFGMVYYAFSVSMCIGSLPDVVPFLISLSAASTSPCITSRTHTRARARTHARSHACTHARTHERTRDVKTALAKTSSTAPLHTQIYTTIFIHLSEVEQCTVNELAECSTRQHRIRTWVLSFVNPLLDFESNCATGTAFASAAQRHITTLLQPVIQGVHLRVYTLSTWPDEDAVGYSGEPQCWRTTAPFTQS